MIPLEFASGKVQNYSGIIMQRVSKAKRPAASVRSNHPLVGIWEQQYNPFHKTSVVYEIRVNDRQFVVNGREEETGDSLEVSGVAWDGETLRFKTYFEPTNYTATHAMRIVGSGRANHDVGKHREHWIRRPDPKFR